MTQRIKAIDSHTAGEPTRVIVDGGPNLGDGTLTERLERFRDSFDAYRAATVNEPRGNDVLVGALLCVPHQKDCVAGVIFFNNVGYLGMCGHGMIGLIATLRYLGRINVGTFKVDTPVGTVTATLHPDGSASIENVVSRRVARDVEISVDALGKFVGDVAWGGNWFYLVKEPVWDFSTISLNELLHIASSIRREINGSGFPEIDHVELFGQPCHPQSDSRNFVLCPGDQYDRSPCGTGTSAKLACIAADGNLQPGKPWRQEGILGTAFQGSYQWSDRPDGSIIPTITGTAHVVAEIELILDPSDPFCWGIGSRNR